MSPGSFVVETSDLIAPVHDQDAVNFVTGWHGSLPERCGGGKRWMSLFCLPSRTSLFGGYDKMVADLSAWGVGPLVYRVQGGAPQNVYIQVSTLNGRPARGRGRASDVDVSPGFWLDADCKDRAFKDSDAVAAMVSDLDEAGIGPQIVVLSGSGGAHLYWRTTNPLDQNGMRMWSERIRLLVQDRHGVMLDSVAEPNRVLRLPGTLWIGSGGRAGQVAPVKLDRMSPVIERVDLDLVDVMTCDMWERHVNERRSVRESARVMDRDAIERWRPDESLRALVLGGEGSGWSGEIDWAILHALHEAEQVYNEKVPWEAILGSAGWTKHGGPDQEGRQQWTRPAAPGEKVNPRSIVVGWVGSPNVAKLMSDSERTGLKHLADAGIPLTKSVVSAALHFDGDKSDMLFRFIKSKASGSGSGSGEH